MIMFSQSELEKPLRSALLEKIIEKEEFWNHVL